MLSVAICYTLLMGYLFDPPVPYFPIEISRVLATGPKAYWSFIISTIFLFPFLPQNRYVMISWACVLGLGIVDDKTNWTIHMMFVFGIFITTLIKSSREDLFLLFIAGNLLHFKNTI